MKNAKKFLAIILVIITIFSCVSVVFASDDTIVYGDVNNSNSINLEDITVMLKYIAKWELTEREFEFAAADVTFDGFVTLSDVTKVLQYIAGWDKYVLC